MKTVVFDGRNNGTLIFAACTGLVLDKYIEYLLMAVSDRERKRQWMFFISRKGKSCYCSAIKKTLDQFLSPSRDGSEKGTLDEKDVTDSIPFFIERVLLEIPVQRSIPVSSSIFLVGIILGVSYRAVFCRSRFFSLFSNHRQLLQNLLYEADISTLRCTD